MVDTKDVPWYEELTTIPLDTDLDIELGVPAIEFSVLMEIGWSEDERVWLLVHAPYFYCRHYPLPRWITLV